MQDHRQSEMERTRAVHVLVVDENPHVLDETCTRLLAEGCDVSACQTAKHLRRTIQRFQPDLVILDVLMKSLDLRDVAALLAEDRRGTLPALALHTRLTRQLLGIVVDVDRTLGIIPKHTHVADFSAAFRTVVNQLPALASEDPHPERRLGAGSSGTHRIGEFRVRLVATDTLSDTARVQRA